MGSLKNSVNAGSYILPRTIGVVSLLVIIVCLASTFTFYGT